MLFPWHHCIKNLTIDLTLHFSAEPPKSNKKFNADHFSQRPETQKESKRKETVRDGFSILWNIIQHWISLGQPPLAGLQEGLTLCRHSQHRGVLRTQALPPTLQDVRVTLPLCTSSVVDQNNVMHHNHETFPTPKTWAYFWDCFSFPLTFYSTCAFKSTK